MTLGRLFGKENGAENGAAKKTAKNGFWGGFWAGMGRPKRPKRAPKMRLFWGRQKSHEKLAKKVKRAGRAAVPLEALS